MTCFTSGSPTSFLNQALVSNSQSWSLLRCPTELANMHYPRCTCCVPPHPDPHCPPTPTLSSLPVLAAISYAGAQDPKWGGVGVASLLPSSSPAWLPFWALSEPLSRAAAPLTRTSHLAQTVLPASSWVPAFPILGSLAIISTQPQKWSSPNAR